MAWAAWNRQHGISLKVLGATFGCQESGNPAARSLLTPNTWHLTPAFLTCCTKTPYYSPATITNPAPTLRGCRPVSNNSRLYRIPWRWETGRAPQDTVPRQSADRLRPPEPTLRRALSDRQWRRLWYGRSPD